MPYRICLISLGCAKNQVNSEQMLYLLNQAGHEVVGEVDGCDVAIVNTCGFIAVSYTHLTLPTILLV